jgi:hypothetical protein
VEAAENVNRTLEEKSPSKDNKTEFKAGQPKAPKLGHTEPLYEEGNPPDRAIVAVPLTLPA